MEFKLVSIAVLIAFYGCYFVKMLRQKKQGIFVFTFCILAYYGCFLTGFCAFSLFFLSLCITCKLSVWKRIFCQISLEMNICNIGKRFIVILAERGQKYGTYNRVG